MAMGKRKSEQAPMWVSTTDLPVSPGHPFYARLNTILDEAGALLGRVSPRRGALGLVGIRWGSLDLAALG
jgi:hypothetical protein